MNIALIGYGKMGKEVESIALERNHNVVFKATSSNVNWEKELPKGCDVAIEFSKPEAAINNIYKSFSVGLPIVTGTTGWYDKMEEVKQSCIKQNQTLFWASNFSIGVNLYFKLAKQLSAMMKQHSEYHPFLTEYHHIHKKDAPSGTAISISKMVESEMNNIKGWKLVSDKEEKVGSDLLPILALREGEIIGTHTLDFVSDIDTISITHEAKNRKGFALGAVLAAEWSQGKKGVFSMNNLLNL